MCEGVVEICLRFGRVVWGFVIFCLKGRWMFWDFGLVGYELSFVDGGRVGFLVRWIWCCMCGEVLVLWVEDGWSCKGIMFYCMRGMDY